MNQTSVAVAAVANVTIKAAAIAAAVVAVKNNKFPSNKKKRLNRVALFVYRFSWRLVYENIPTKYILDLAALDALDVVVELERLRTALAIAVSVDCLFC